MLDRIAHDAYGICGLKPDELYSMSLGEFEQMRDARMDVERAHDMQQAQLSFIMTNAWSSSDKTPDIEDFLIYPPDKKRDPQSPDEQLTYIEGMNAIMGGN